MAGNIGLCPFKKYPRLCRGIIIAYYESYAKNNGCPVLRMDTNEKNSAARRLYARLGYREAGIVPCVFNGIKGVGLVCLEKRV